MLRELNAEHHGLESASRSKYWCGLDGAVILSVKRPRTLCRPSAIKLQWIDALCSKTGCSVAAEVTNIELMREKNLALKEVLSCARRYS